MFSHLRSGLAGHSRGVYTSGRFEKYSGTPRGCSAKLAVSYQVLAFRFSLTAVHPPARARFSSNWCNRRHRSLKRVGHANTRRLLNTERSENVDDASTSHYRICDSKEDTIKVPEYDIDRHYCQFTSNRGNRTSPRPLKGCGDFNLSTKLYFAIILRYFDFNPLLIRRNFSCLEP
jgi:hypothetical protein